MSFRNFLTDPEYRKHLINEAQREQNALPPTNPKREQIDALVLQFYVINSGKAR